MGQDERNKFYKYLYRISCLDTTAVFHVLAYDAAEAVSVLDKRLRACCCSHEYADVKIAYDGDFPIRVWVHKIDE